MRRRPKKNTYLDLPAKANKVLNLVLIALAILLVRAWHLSVIQYEDRVEEAKKPRQRVVLEPAKRGTIRDRFNTPLAINKIQYNASILYSQIRQIPSIVWEKIEGKKVRVFKRREYIRRLSKVLGEELYLDRDRIEDLIHSKASFYFNVPFIIKEDISEKEYYRLKMLEKDFPGIFCQHLPKRVYPQGKVASDIIGYMGAISSDEYERIIVEKKTLEKFLKLYDAGESPEFPENIQTALQARNRLKELWEKAYTINDYVGKAGIEGKFEEDLRGFHGKRSYSSDARGNFLRELPGGRDPLSGKRILLTISSELQKYAEELLIQNEKIRFPRVSGVDHVTKQVLALKQPWIKGGAIVAMDPHTGEVLALASHPRFDPNDFIKSGNSDAMKKKFEGVRRWFETESYAAEIWDQKRPLEREYFDKEANSVQEQSLDMTWENYLALILPENSPVKEAFRKTNSIQGAIRVQRGQKIVEELADLYDQRLFLDLCRLIIDENRFSDDLVKAVGSQTLDRYKQTQSAFGVVQDTVKKMTEHLFQELVFKPWRREHQPEFLKQKRIEEKQAGVKYAKPYTDILDKKQKEMFSLFWEAYRYDFMLSFVQGVKIENELLTPFDTHFRMWHQELSQGAHQNVPWREAYDEMQSAVSGLKKDLALEYIQTFRSYRELDEPLYGSYRFLRGKKGKQKLKDLACAFYPKYGFGYGRSQCYRQASTQGSIFKLVSGYAGLLKKYEELGDAPKTFENLNPLTLVDDYHKEGDSSVLGYFEDGKPIPYLYKGGRLIKSHSGGLGKLDIIRALEQTSNPYFSILAGDVLDDPEDLANIARSLSYGSKTGIDLTGEISGKVPQDLRFNQNGLYATAIGQHSMVVTPLQTAVMLSAIANGGKIHKPNIVWMMAGTASQEGANTLFCPTHFEYQETLASVGIDFPIFTEACVKNEKKNVKLACVEVKREVYMPREIREILMTAMLRVVEKTETSGLATLSRLYKDHPEAISDLLDMEGKLIGKTSTAESVENLDLDGKIGTNTYNHIWFGAIALDKDSETYVYKDSFGNPELVVVVYLRYGGWGKDAAPIAAQVAQKWKEIKKEKSG